MGTTFRFSELRELHSRGFALIWLHPRTKAPIGLGWTKKEKLSFDDLKKHYVKGNNVGVRLGNISKVDGGFLAVIDLDVKGSKPEHRKEAEEKLLKLYPEAAKTAPVVHSGRGNGSAHYYVILSEATSGQERKAQSSEIVKVKMPSVDPSKRELEKLTPEELTQGVRLRAAWEISVMSEGRQVVLPGSVHPDTGRNYQWAEGRGLDRAKLPCITNDKGKGAASNGKAVLGPHVNRSTDSAPAKLNLSQVDVESLGLRSDQVEAIRSGAGVTDRSASLFALSMALMQRGKSDSVILSVLTDRRYWLGQTGFDHAKTEDRARAARWIQKYTLPRAREQVDASSFGDVEEIGPNEDGEKQASPELAINEISGPGAQSFDEAGDWKKELDLQPGPKGALPTIRATFKNLQLILLNTIGPDFLQFDDFSQREFWAYDVPWGLEKNAQRSAGTADEIKLKSWLIEVWGVEVSLNMLTETLAWFSGQNHFHPVKDYLDTLDWDGTERIERAFETYLGARMNKAYLRAVSKKFFLALIARIYEPGCKFDHLPVLEGKQGIGKSTFGRILVGDKWFMDGLPDLSDKDAALNLTGIWLCEMSELSSLYRTQLEVAKAFITRQVDKVRPPYGARRVELPRQTVFLGTTNERDYLQDSTGNRRFWPVLISGCDFKALSRDREQLLAEAYWCYLTEMEPLYLQGQALRIAEAVQESRRVEDEGDAMRDVLKEWLKVKKHPNFKTTARIKLDDLFSVGPFTKFQNTTRNKMIAGRVLRSLGYRKLVNNSEGRLWANEEGLRKPGRQ